MRQDGPIKSMVTRGPRIKSVDPRVKPLRRPCSVWAPQPVDARAEHAHDERWREPAP
jgi:hypothetical protein